MKKFAALAAASVASGIGLLALASPAQALVTCAGNGTLGSGMSLVAGSGANCGFLAVGQSFEIDVTPFFDFNKPNFSTTQFGIGIVTPGGTTVSFSNVQARVRGFLGASPFPLTPANPGDLAPIGIWAGNVTDTIPGLGAPAPFGTAASASFGYTAESPFNSVFREISFDFTETGFGAFGSFKASPMQIGLTQVDQFLITGTLDSVGDPLAPNVISFAVGPSGIPTVEGSTFGGFFTTQVPGPLPIAGAGAAFAWSRKLRRKQKLGAGN